MSTQMRTGIIGAIGVLLFLLSARAVEAQEGHDDLDQAIVLFEESEWERAVESFNQLLEAGGLSKSEKSRVRKYLSWSYIMLGQEDKVVGVFKDIVRDDPDFDVDALALDRTDPPLAMVRYFGEALVKVRQEEIWEWKDKLRGTSRQAALLRSVVLPGWGQRYQGYSKRGYIMLGMTAASIAYATIAEKSFQDAQDAYDRAAEGADFDKLHTDYTEKADRADLALGIVGAMWLLNVVDAASQGPNITGPPSGLGLAPARPGGLQVVYVTRF